MLLWFFIFISEIWQLVHNMRGPLDLGLLLEEQQVETMTRRVSVQICLVCQLCLFQDWEETCLSILILAFPCCFIARKKKPSKGRGKLYQVCSFSVTYPGQQLKWSSAEDELKAIVEKGKVRIPTLGGSCVWKAPPHMFSSSPAFLFWLTLL